MIQAFSSSAVGGLLTSVFTASKIVARSSSASDTGTLTVSGTVSGAGDSDTLTLTGQREVLGTKDFTAVVSGVLSAAQAGTVSFFTEGTKAAGTMIVTSNPTAGDTLTLGITGATKTYTFVSASPSIDGDVLIGATASDTASNLRKAIRGGDAALNDGTGAGTLYGVDTSANLYLTVSAVSGQILTLEDRIGCARQLAYVITQTGTGLSLGVPTGGVSGTLLGTISAAGVRINSAIVLDDETVTAAQLPALTDWYSDWVRVGGKPCSIYLKSSNVATAMTCQYQVSTASDQSVFRTTSLTSLDNNELLVTPTEHIEWLRLRVNNTNTSAASVNAKVCY